MRGIIPAVTVTPSPGWWNGRHSRLKSGGRKACGFDSRPGHAAAVRLSTRSTALGIVVDCDRSVTGRVTDFRGRLALLNPSYEIIPR